MCVRRLARHFTLLSMCLATLSVARADDKSAAAEPPANKSAADNSRPDPAAKAALADFDTAFAEFKTVLGQLRALQGKYQLATSGQRAALQQQFDQMVDQGRKLAPRVQATAEAAYQAAPNQNKAITDFLITELAAAVKNDRYEEADRVGKLLRENHCPAPEINNFMGQAAFAAHDFAAAKHDLEAASKAGMIDDAGKSELGLADEYVGLWAKEQEIRAAEAEADDLPRVKIVTSKGDIVVELFENEAPIATANFINLVEKHFYDGLIFHRVIPGFMAQGGDPQGDGSGGPGYTIPCEVFQENHRSHFRGSLSMAKKEQRDSGGSQFFLTFVPTGHLNGKHTVFGRVIEGLDVLEKLQRVDPGHRGGISPDKIVKAEVLRKRDHKYEPIKGPDR